ncbi:MAG: hypothetical protein IKQ55_00510 [Kiritimatiellae bacterium]|nr:hypothetical protein [Kiritimatiellia bacterium]
MDNAQIQDKENLYRKALMPLMSHLIKNAEKIPEATLAAALDFEAFRWSKLPVEDKRARLATVRTETAAKGSRIEKHFADYPHPFSKQLYADYLLALREYASALGI